MSFYWASFRMYVEGNSSHAIGRILKVNPQSVVRTRSLAGKNAVYLLTVVDRATRCVLSWDVVAERTSEVMQACREHAPQAKQYYSDAFPVYDILYYGAPNELRPDKLETYSVEAVNADRRHYLKRLARKSRCFLIRLHGLLENLRLFVYGYNDRH